MEAFTVLANANGDHGWWFPIFPLLWTALIVGAIYLFMRGRRRGGGNRAREIVAERYASGELTVEEYRQRLAELG
jgi:putative membrane protein